ncbi:MAG TPA: DUF2798 domain-containing protein [Bauldia sp.]|nr:DUF2798 domain-containing protein [Bauldia sp.]
MSAMMSFLVSGIAPVRNAGIVDGFFGLWIGAWLPSWFIAFPVVLFVAPVARRVVGGSSPPEKKSAAAGPRRVTDKTGGGRPGGTNRPAPTPPARAPSPSDCSGAVSSCGSRAPGRRHADRPRR